MASKKISELTDGGGLLNGDVLPAARSGANVGVTGAGLMLAANKAASALSAQVDRARLSFPAQGATYIGGTFYVCHRGPTGTLWARIYSGLYVFKSTDNGETWTCPNIAAPLTGIVSIQQILELASGVVLAMCRVSGGAGLGPSVVMRSTDGGATWSQPAGQPLPQSAWSNANYPYMLGQQSWFQMPASSPVAPGAIFAAEYGDNPAPRGPMRLYKSTDDGLTWTAAHTWDPASPADASDSIRHMHSTQYDPYVAGRLWVCIGDSAPGEPRIGYSDDAGATFTWITSMATNVPRGLPGGGYAQSRAVSLMFAPDAVFWGGDTPETTVYIYRYDRATHAITQAAGPFPNSFQACAITFKPADGSGPYLLTVGSVEPDTQINRDDLLRVVGSADGGATWNETELNWRRTQTTANALVKAGVWAFAEPDANGVMWIQYDGIDAPTSAAVQTPLCAVRARLVKRRAASAPVSHAPVAVKIGMRAIPVSGVIPASALAATSGFAVLYSADTDMMIEVPTAVASADTALASDAANYWTLELAAINLTTGASKGTIMQFGGASHAQVAGAAWNVLNSNGLLKIAAGDGIGFRAIRTGTPTNLANPRVTTILRRANFVLA